MAVGLGLVTYGLVLIATAHSLAALFQVSLAWTEFAFMLMIEHRHQKSVLSSEIIPLF